MTRPKRSSRSPVVSAVAVGIAFLASVLPFTLQVSVPGSEGARAPVLIAKLTTEASPDVTVGTPARLVIPRLGIDTAIEPVGVLDNGNLGTPEDPFNAGWYEGGARPGEEGTAVLDGHLNLNGEPTIFRRLKLMRPGQKIRVTDDLGRTRTFIVEETATYRVHEAPLEKIFRHDGAEGRFLHLITCAGEWDTALDHYNARHIVYAREMVL